MAAAAQQQPNSIAMQNQNVIVDIRPLLQRLWPDPGKEKVTAQEIAEAISLIFVNKLSPVQTGSLLTALHFTGWDRRADVLAETSAAMRRHAANIDFASLEAAISKGRRPEGKYHGGLVSFLPSSGRHESVFVI
jgi:anthranilate phosphoribosyltransferase